jgi:hypothetical protein
MMRRTIGRIGTAGGRAPTSYRHWQAQHDIAVVGLRGRVRDTAVAIGGVEPNRAIRVVARQRFVDVASNIGESAAFEG